MSRVNEAGAIRAGNKKICSAEKSKVYGARSAQRWSSSAVTALHERVRQELFHNRE